MTIEKFTGDAKMLQIYSNKYCTVADNSKLYLLESTKLIVDNIIAILDVEENCTILNRDKVNVFIDFSHEHFGNDESIDKLPEQKIKEYLVNFLWPDINELVAFNDSDYRKLDLLISKFNAQDRHAIYTAMATLGISKEHNMHFTRVYSFNQIEHLLSKQYYYICLNTHKLRYAVSSSNYKQYFSNGACGPWTKLRKHLDFYYVIFFEKSDETSLTTKDIEKLFKEDLATDPYTVANHLLSLEDKFTKSINEMISIITSKQGVIAANAVYYPNIGNYADDIAIILHRYQKEVDASIKLELFNTLRDLYSNVYSEFSKAQVCLRSLCTQNEQEKELICTAIE